MSQRLLTIIKAVKDGARLFVSPFSEAYAPPVRVLSSIDRYFANVGRYLIDARNRFEHEYMGAAHADK
ncbi:MAG: hypothetical protein ILM98_07260 [Kiritimatiellae bacterium]|nr:hypothetical protein [Kiritimatiellia bacterium]